MAVISKQFNHYQQNPFAASRSQESPLERVCRAWPRHKRCFPGILASNATSSLETIVPGTGSFHALASCRFTPKTHGCLVETVQQLPNPGQSQQHPATESGRENRFRARHQPGQGTAASHGSARR